jgi:hypothetical protein
LKPKNRKKKETFSKFMLNDGSCRLGPESKRVYLLKRFQKNISKRKKKKTKRRIEKATLQQALE